MKKPQIPPDWLQHMSSSESPQDFFQRLRTAEVQKFVAKANNEYLHWDKVRRYPMPDGIHPVAMWAAIELSRATQRDVEISEEGDDYFRFWSPPKHQEWLHRIDQDAGGFIGSRSRIVPRDGDDRYLYNSLMEEAIASSQLEGASTTRIIAKQMLRTGRKPKNKHEQMIVNNYKAILEIRDSLRDKLTPEFLCHIQQVITEETLSNSDAAGRFRTTADGDVCVADSITDDVIFKPPSVHSINRRIEEICDFANDKSEPFIHPVIKAIILHFSIGYIHPFVDGNGRTARAIFYWYMLKSGYWIFEFLPISRIILDSPVKYARAYLYTETDSRDLTYFIHYHLRVIDRAVREMMEYIERQQAYLHEAHALIDSMELNSRQLDAAYRALRYPHTAQTFREHAGVHGVSLNTARNDLVELEKQGVLESRKVGKTLTFVAVESFRKQLKPGAFTEVKRKIKERSLAVTRTPPSNWSQNSDPDIKDDEQRTLIFGD